MLHDVAWLTHPWLCWGILPIIAANIGYWIPALLLEALLCSRWAQSSRLIQRGESGRHNASQEERLTVASLKRQYSQAFWVLLGPTALLNGALSAVIMPILCGTPQSTLPSLGEFLLHFVLLQLIGDFGLYVGHRIQHEVPFLWRNFHALHHSFKTPTPATTLYIDSTDATLQAGLPIVLAAACVRPHPLTGNVYILLRIAENVCNHSGLDDGLVDLITLKFLPGRARIMHHDLHHRFGGTQKDGANAKNYGENFYLWDWAFGTLSSFGRSARPPSS